jgi:hypothetical protein
MFSSTTESEETIDFTVKDLDNKEESGSKTY